MSLSLEHTRDLMSDEAMSLLLAHTRDLVSLR